MALTAAREIALYQILEVPYTMAVNILAPTGLTAQPVDVTSSAIAARTLITAHLTTYIYSVADVLTVLEARLDDWIDLGVDTTTIDNGAVGNIQGLRMDPDADRAEIRKQVLVLVPFYRAHEEIQRKGTSEWCPIYH